MSSLQLRGVTVAGPTGPPLLDAVDLDLADGESVAVIGPSAASRTALLRTIVGLQAPDEGEILIDEVDVTGRAPRRRDVAMVFSDHALHPRRDVLDNLTFAATLRRKHDRAELAERVEHVVDELALRDVLDLRPHRLGTDQQQRVAIGRSLVRDASVWLFDDPFSAQSERVRPHLRSVVLRWQTDRERTSLITTSSVDEALSLVGRVAVLHQGRIRQVGSPQELYDDPADMFVAGYLGSPPMNLLPAFRDGDQLVTPLAAILGLAITLGRDDIELETDEVHELGTRIASNARKLDRLVHDLLTELVAQTADADDGFFGGANRCHESRCRAVVGAASAAMPFMDARECAGLSP